jgi:hypothetical protein
VLLQIAVGKAGYVSGIITGTGTIAFEFFLLWEILCFKSPEDSSRYINPEQLVDRYTAFITRKPNSVVEDSSDHD